VELMEKALRQVMIAAPDNQHAYNALGYSLAERNERLPEAYTLIDKACRWRRAIPSSWTAWAGCSTAWAT
jgi:Flp pilus assembly protein TadD